jgi:hypothetical protein
MKYCVERIYAAQTNTLGNRNSKRKGGTKNYTGNTANDDVELGHVTSLRPDIYIYIYIYIPALIHCRAYSEPSMERVAQTERARKDKRTDP